MSMNDECVKNCPSARFEFKSIIYANNGNIFSLKNILKCKFVILFNYFGPQGG